MAGNIEKIGALFSAAITETRGEDGQIKKGINFEMLNRDSEGSVIYRSM